MQLICSQCSGTTRVHRNRKTGKLLCHNCARRDPSKQETCSKCTKPGLVEKRKDNGQAICKRCCGKARYKDISRHEKCCFCGETKHVAVRTGSGKAVCQNCYRQGNIGTCEDCGNDDVVICAKGLCGTCYQQIWRKEQRKIAETAA